MAGSEDRQSILLLWLKLLGWQVEVRRVGDRLAGVARHCAADGSTVRVAGSAPTRDELAFRLFEAAMKLVEARTPRQRRPPLAA